MAAIPRVLSAKLTVTLHWQDPRSSTLTWAECRIPDIDDFRWWFFTQKRLLVLHCQRYDDAHMEMAQDVTHRGPVQHLNATLRLAGWQSDVHQFNQAGPFTISRYLYQSSPTSPILHWSDVMLAGEAITQAKATGRPLPEEILKYFRSTQH